MQWNKRAKIVLVVKETETNREAALYRWQTQEKMAQNGPHSQGEERVKLGYTGDIFNRYCHVQAKQAVSISRCPGPSNATFLTRVSPYLEQ